jgi:hypothetical protein
MPVRLHRTGFRLRPEWLTRLCAVRVLPNHRDVLALADNLETKSLGCRDDVSLRGILGERGHQSVFTMTCPP